MAEAWKKKGIELFTAPGFHGASASREKVWDILIGGSDDDYIKTYDRCMELVASVKPSLVVVDFVFVQALDAAQVSGIKYAVMSPVSPLWFVGKSQPRLGCLWKYPA